MLKGKLELLEGGLSIAVPHKYSDSISIKTLNKLAMGDPIVKNYFLGGTKKGGDGLLICFSLICGVTVGHLFF